MTSPSGNDRRALAPAAEPGHTQPQPTPGPPRAESDLPHGRAPYLAPVAFGAGSVARRPPAAPDADGRLGRTAQGDWAARDPLLARHQKNPRRAVACRLDRRLAARVDPSDVVQEALAEASRRLPEFARARIFLPVQPVEAHPCLSAPIVLKYSAIGGPFPPCVSLTGRGAYQARVSSLRASVLRETPLTGGYKSQDQRSSTENGWGRPLCRPVRPPLFVAPPRRLLDKPGAAPKQRAGHPPKQGLVARGNWSRCCSWRTSWPARAASSLVQGPPPCHVCPPRKKFARARMFLYRGGS
jgi:hypothetical protein